MKKLLVIGSASFDVLHLADRTVACAGGAGMYTAMAARRCGAQVSLFGPRPEPVPEQLVPIAERLYEWLGPLISAEQIPRFEISYRDGDTKYLHTLLDTETSLSPTSLPEDLSQYDLIHVTPLGDAGKQASFIRACRQRGAKLISGGTGLFIVEQQPGIVRAVIEQVDYFFMNVREAVDLYGSLEVTSNEPGKVIYVTQGAQGVLVIQGDIKTRIPAVSTSELHPTGAGDTFCGATLAYLMERRHPIMAARQAASLASEMITQVGPTALFLGEPPPEIPLDHRVRLDNQQVGWVADVISRLPDASPYPFVSPALPPIGHPGTLDYFTTATLQQFGFWYADDNGYQRPMIARIGGVDLKGSDYLWEAFRRRQEADMGFCSPAHQSQISLDELLEVYRTDDGRDPMPVVGTHLSEANSYGRDMLALELTPQALLSEAMASPDSLDAFLVRLDQVGGYKADPLRKKSSLLAMILNQRPEKFLSLREDEQLAPVIDYHAMRTCLRVGLVEVLEDNLAVKLHKRQFVTPEEEWAVRYAAYRATEQVTALSGRSMGAVDWLFFSARVRCPEMSEPECRRCPLDLACAHRKDLFQPILRTSFY